MWVWGKEGSLTYMPQILKISNHTAHVAGLHGRVAGQEELADRGVPAEGCAVERGSPFVIPRVNLRIAALRTRALLPDGTFQCSSFFKRNGSSEEAASSWPWTSAPPSRSSSQVSVCPMRAAPCSAVRPQKKAAMDQLRNPCRLSTETYVFEVSFSALTTQSFVHIS